MYQQQEHLSDDRYQDEAKSTYGAYEGFTTPPEDVASSYGQGSKIGIAASRQGPAWEYRLGLIITSLVFWMIFFFVMVFIIATPGSVDLNPLLIAGFSIFTLLIIGANLLFNRKS